MATEYEERRFFLWRSGKLYATPILLTLVFIEATDVLFAVDSVPATFAITREPLVVYTSNMFAILGLRACKVPLVALWLGAHSDLCWAQDVLAQHSLAGAFPIRDIPLCDRWNSGGIDCFVARVPCFPHTEGPAN